MEKSTFIVVCPFCKKENTLPKAEQHVIKHHKCVYEECNKDFYFILNQILEIEYVQGVFY